MKKIKYALLTALFLSTSSAFAKIEFNIDTGGGNPGADAALISEVNKQFQLIDMTGFLQSMSNAQSMTNKGQGVSYASEQSLFVVGGGAGLGLNAPSGLTTNFDTKGGLPPIGVGLQGSLMVGVSLAKLPVPALGPIDLKRLTVFVNYFGLSNDSLVDSVTMKTSTFGLHFQYKLLQGFNLGGIGLLNWGGLALTTGFDVSSNSLSYKVGQKLETSYGGETLSWTPSAGSNLTLDASAFTIPIEVSTSVRLAYIFSLFAGVGVDINSGKSSISANLTGPVTNTSATINGTASLTGSEEKGPTVGGARFFVGPQFNIVPLKNTNVVSIFAQFNVATSGNYGFHTGLRIAW